MVSFFSCNYNTVIKAAGLAGGKGVIVPDTRSEGSKAVDILKELGEASQKIIVEKRLYGEEVSVGKIILLVRFLNNERIL